MKLLAPLLACVLLVVGAGADAGEAPSPFDDFEIHAASAGELAATRAQLIAFIWGDAGFPRSRSERIAKKAASPVDGVEQLARVEELRITLPRISGDPVVVKGYHFMPARPNHRLVLLHNGHGCPATFADGGRGYGMDKLIRALVSRGFGVAALYMPLQSEGQCEPKHHGDLFTQAPARRNGLAFFLEPAAQTLNYLLSRRGAYRDVTMIGFSGGGWATTVYSALDPRVKLSIPVAGSVPLYLRKAQYSHDEEQFHAPFYRLAGFPDLYVLAASEGRRQIQVLNRNDPCCFSAVFHDPALPRVAAQPAVQRDFEASVRGYERRVKAVLAGLGPGSFDIIIDENSRHSISDTTIERVILPALTN